MSSRARASERSPSRKRLAASSMYHCSRRLLPSRTVATRRSRRVRATRRSARSPARHASSSGSSRAMASPSPSIQISNGRACFPSARRASSPARRAARATRRRCSWPSRSACKACTPTPSSTCARRAAAIASSSFATRGARANGRARGRATRRVGPPRSGASCAPTWARRASSGCAGRIFVGISAMSTCARCVPVRAVGWRRARARTCRRPQAPARAGARSRSRSSRRRRSTWCLFSAMRVAAARRASSRSLTFLSPSFARRPTASSASWHHRRRVVSTRASAARPSSRPARTSSCRSRSTS
mmetsp:Transcript_6596/g.20776  ORF Transcript_6596/g.20776 Transcript_6596/m.20776 type:complete len:302 (+) Transcript_6596:257-1162(+)